MYVGILQFVTARTIGATELAVACEERGIESLWVPEHPVVPVEYRTRYPLSEDGKLPRPYTELPDPFPVLSAAAAVTSRLRVGTGICLVPERDPLMTALQVATVDWLSGGRFLFGVGAGWLGEEMGLFTPHFPYRFGYLREAVSAMRRLWSGEPVDFEGKWIRIPKVVCRPAPVQRPHPPVILGMNGPKALERVAAYGDGWMPIAAPPDTVKRGRAKIDRLAREAGRDPAAISITVMLGAPPGMEDPAPYALPGRDVVASYADAAADRLVVSIPSLDRDGTLVHLDRIAGAIA